MIMARILRWTDRIAFAVVLLFLMWLIVPSVYLALAEVVRAWHHEMIDMVSTSVGKAVLWVIGAAMFWCFVRIDKLKER